jgi:phosphoribosyl 1,2-cyclic phosphodiesterase
MSLFVTSLNSGSNGNCYYIGNGNEAVLVDIGISCREVEKRMKRLGLSMTSIKAIFISHEHTDHISGLKMFVKKYQLPVYITDATLREARLGIDKQWVRTFAAHKSISIGALSVIPFPKFHDASDPYSFVIHNETVRVGVFTDIGISCRHVIHYFRQCHAVFLEANYDEQMLRDGGYPVYLKKRISGGVGHLSNKQALELFLEHKPPFMTHLFLSHLSKNNNHPSLVQRLFDDHAGTVKMIIASRENETPIYHIQNEEAPARNFIRFPIAPTQLSFSFT